MKCPHCNKYILGHQIRTRERTEFVYERIQDCKTKKAEFIFRSCKSKGYVNSRKTFQRDIKKLESEGQINLEIMKRGRQRSQTIIHLI